MERGMKPTKERGECNITFNLWEGEGGQEAKDPDPGVKPEEAQEHNARALPAEHWRNLGKIALNNALNNNLNENEAKNVILFLGDGLDIHTSTASRIYKGQLVGKTGEEGYLMWETFPHVALSKTYNTNSQVADSAGTATAFLSGVKTKLGVLGYDDNIIPSDCSSEAKAEKLSTILDDAITAGKFLKNRAAFELN
ncbi:putative alkaline phosphatase, tissue-nonspecific isozyme [Apostichopus japonicus]|uniref:alkaline phosphatase n=1 Tax=Stichopus japonicus TaxID=307972 RepID=A0A2G8KEC6_STIJA|nr:putative alkaline phosphatase, tissue-nonspecific isozyme [Apostichopus japonicus]